MLLLFVIGSCRIAGKQCKQHEHMDEQSSYLSREVVVMATTTTHPSPPYTDLSLSLTIRDVPVPSIELSMYNPILAGHSRKNNLKNKNKNNKTRHTERPNDRQTQQRDHRAACAVGTKRASLFFLSFFLCCCCCCFKGGGRGLLFVVM